MKDGTQVARNLGTPQGDVISPLLANLFLHYAFDAWMRRTYPGVPFERYADGIVIHCKSEEQTLCIHRNLKEWRQSASWNFTQRKQRSLIAKMPTGMTIMTRSVLIFSGIPFDQGCRRIAGNSINEIKSIESICSPLLKELGYPVIFEEKHRRIKPLQMIYYKTIDAIYILKFEISHHHTIHGIINFIKMMKHPS